MINKHFCKFLVLFLLCSPWSLVAQKQSYCPDTVIKYSLLSKDTISKQPVWKETFLYDYKFRLKEKSIFTWNSTEKNWNKSKKFELTYYPTEIVVNCFNIEGKNQEIQTQRILIQLDSHANILEVNIQRKDRYSAKFNLFEKKTFSYKRDTLMLEQHFRMINQLMLDKEVKYLYTKDLIVEKEVVYDIEGKEKAALQHRVHMKGGKISRTQTIESFTPKDTLVEKFEYTEQGVNKKMTNLICTTKEKGKHTHKPLYPNQVLFQYDKEGNLIYEVSMKLSTENLVQIDRENYLMRMIYATKTPQSSVVNYGIPKLNDFLK